MEVNKLLADLEGDDLILYRVENTVVDNFLCPRFLYPSSPHVLAVVMLGMLHYVLVEILAVLVLVLLRHSRVQAHYLSLSSSHSHYLHE
jgi:hypothetical protein